MSEPISLKEEEKLYEHLNDSPPQSPPHRLEEELAERLIPSPKRETPIEEGDGFDQASNSDKNSKTDERALPETENPTPDQEAAQDEDDGLDLASDPDQAPMITKDKADAEFRAGNYDKALKFYSKALLAVNILARGGTVDTHDLIMKYAKQVIVSYD